MMPTDGNRLLVIDDEEGVRELIADALRTAGYHVVEAGDGAEGLQIDVALNARGNGSPCFAPPNVGRPSRSPTSSTARWRRPDAT